MPDQPDKPKPTIEERLEAVAQTFKIMAGVKLANEKAIAANSRAIAETRAALDDLAAITAGHSDSIEMAYIRISKIEAWRRRNERREPLAG